MFDILRDNWQLLLVGQYPQGPLGGLALTLILSVLGLVISFPISILLAVARVSPWKVFRVPATVIVYVVRGVPLVMLIFWSYFLVPLLVGHGVTGFTTLLCTLIIYEAAYLSEVVRAGIEALPRGQTEAARALGLSYLQTLRQIILPQAIYNMVPSIVSQFVSTIKETSLGYVISVQELTFSANQVNTNLLTRPFEVFLILALIYFAVCFCLTQFAHSLERRVTRRRSGAAASNRSYQNDSVLQSQ
ncbi:amino acid ABC transporter permease [Cupriavidus basilensis]|uniref:Amino acid ABC transporter permease n=1 Tax=Cupriavidus basilensis TaxID=68895 RepID=A0ABT6AQA1_9BURK|nr:amino acid ABC transporter permease [Cupriavidus basilensis]MDF3834794.1 amino acid ABC transporter permease [Cupriavidus basilensis]